MYIIKIKYTYTGVNHIIEVVRRLCLPGVEPRCVEKKTANTDDPLHRKHSF